MTPAKSILALLHRSASAFPTNTALEQGATKLSYRELIAEVDVLRSALRGAGVGPDSRVAIVLPNGLNLAVALLAVTSSAIAAPLNPAYRKPENAAYFNAIRVTHVLVEKGAANAARDLATERGLAVLELGPDRTIVAPPSNRGVAREPEPTDVAMILLTSGSTGRPKKVPLSHGMICASVEDICRTLALSSSDRCLCMWEQFHIGGLVDLLLSPLASGGAVICTEGFQPARFFKHVADSGPTWFQGVPTSLYAILSQLKAVRGFTAGKLRFVRSVASALSPALMQEIEAAIGVPVVQTFGMTEAAPLITTNPLPPGQRKPGSVGQSCGPDIRVDGPDGSQLPQGEVGEILVRGPNVFAGYEDAPEANATSFRDGWFRTGDTGYLDEDGYLYLRGRVKEMINRGGEKIAPQEVDDVLLLHPAIAQAASFSVRHRTLGENVAAAIVFRPGHQLTEAQIRDHVGAYLASFKVPQKLLILERMPVDPVGKVNRLALAMIADPPPEQRQPQT